MNTTTDKFVCLETVVESFCKKLNLHFHEEYKERWQDDDWFQIVISNNFTIHVIQSDSHAEGSYNSEGVYYPASISVFCDKHNHRDRTLIHITSSRKRPSTIDDLDIWGGKRDEVFNSVLEAMMNCIELEKINDQYRKEEDKLF